MHGGYKVINSYITNFLNPRNRVFSVPHTFRLLLSRILLLFLVQGPQLFVNRWPFFMITTKKIFTFFKDGRLLQIHLLFFTLLPQAVAGRKIHTLCQNKTDLSGCQWWNPEHRLAFLGVTLNTSFYYVNFYCKVSCNVLIK